MTTISWISIAPLPGKRQRGTATWINGKLYVLGGWDETGAFRKNLYEYDPWTDAWTEKAPYPLATSGLRDPGSCVINNKLYIIGGNVDSVYSNKIIGYDPSTNTWDSTTIDLAFTVGMPQVEAIGDNIYILGGYLNGAYSNQTWRINVVTKEIVQLANKPTATAYGSAVASGNTIYVPGGYNSTSFAQKQMEIYDALANTWSTGTPLPTVKWAHKTAMIEGMLYVFGGTIWNGAANVPTDEIVEFSFTTYAWTVQTDKLPTPLSNFMLSVYKGDPYIVGGVDTTGAATNQHHVWNANTEVEPEPEPTLGTSKNGFNSSLFNQTMYNQPTGLEQYASANLSGEADLSGTSVKRISYKTNLSGNSSATGLIGRKLNSNTNLIGNSVLSTYGIRRQEGSTLLIGDSTGQFGAVKKVIGITVLINDVDLSAIPFKKGFAGATLNGLASEQAAAVKKTSSITLLNGLGFLSSGSLKKLFASTNLTNLTFLESLLSVKRFSSANLENQSNIEAVGARAIDNRTTIASGTFNTLLFNGGVFNQTVEYHANPIRIRGSVSLESENAKITGFSTEINVIATVSGLISRNLYSDTTLVSASGLTAYGIRNIPGSTLLRVFSDISASSVTKKNGQSQLTNNIILIPKPFKKGFASTSLSSNVITNFNSTRRTGGKTSLYGMGFVTSIPIRLIILQAELHGDFYVLGSSNILANGITDLYGLSELLGIEPFIFRWNPDQREEATWDTETPNVIGWDYNLKEETNWNINDMPKTEWEEKSTQETVWKRVIK